MLILVLCMIDLCIILFLLVVWLLLGIFFIFFFFFKQKTAYELRISDWSSDVCSSDLDRLLPQFLAFQAASQYGRRYFQLSSKQSTNLASINSTQLKQFPVLLPPLPEQRKIAEILRTWDEALEKLEALRAAKLRRHRALTHSLVFGTRQLDRFRITDEVTANRWFTLPASWGSKSIGKLAREISERNGDAEQHEVLSCSKYDGFVRSLEYFKKQVFSADLSGYKKIWRGDFGFPSNQDRKSTRLNSSH